MDDESEKPPARSDLAQALFWLGSGGAIFYGSWTMDRLEKVGVEPYSAPGLLPGVLGIFIVFLGAAMLVRAVRAGALESGARLLDKPIDWRRILPPLALCGIYAGVLVGHGLPIWLASWTFVSAMIYTLQFHERRGELRRLALVALAIGAGAGVVVSLIFQELFLIRLP